MSTGKKIPYDKAMEITRRFLRVIEPYTLKREIAGSLRRQVKMVGDIEIVCIENPFNALSNIFTDDYPGLVVNGQRLKRFKYKKAAIQIELYITSTYDYGRILAIRTGSSAYSHIQLANTWWKKGWSGTIDGLRLRKQCIKKGGRWVIKPGIPKSNIVKPPSFNTEKDFYDFLGIPWIPPKERNWKSKYEKLNYSL